MALSYNQLLTLWLRIVPESTQHSTVRKLIQALSAAAKTQAVDAMKQQVKDELVDHRAKVLAKHPDWVFTTDGDVDTTPEP